ncbi:Alcohol dehydrogenase transcription factor Myb/SANT-like [Popillia japonica]|uniref:Alcohol dehydrogenase transcription factor Myb/SANT-like n=1 Tax=Popillia japonica TaxID=7064 RepID=A0AAW1ISK6_POPJA
MEVFNIKFVGEIEKHPELYDYTLREYSRKDCTEKAWNQVAKKVKLSASECKEKWRNLRSTFVKNLKPKASGCGRSKKKPYYLAECMQFTVPFIKTAGIPTGNLPEIFQQESVDDQDVGISSGEDTYSQSEVSISEQQSHPATSFPSLPPSPRLPLSPQPGPSSESPTSFPSLPPSPRLPLSPQPGPSSESPLDEVILPESTDMRAQVPPAQPTRKRKRPNVESDADKAFAEYFSAKPQKMSNSSSGNLRREGIQSFLNSMLPDLLLMNDVQLRTYKRKALLLIDEVMGTSPTDRPERLMTYEVL